MITFCLEEEVERERKKEEDEMKLNGPVYMWLHVCIRSIRFIVNIRKQTKNVYVLSSLRWMTDIYYNVNVYCVLART